VIFELFRERIGQPREPPHRHPHREVLTLDGQSALQHQIWNPSYNGFTTGSERTMLTRPRGPDEMGSAEATPSMPSTRRLPAATFTSGLSLFRGG
jgi:hypothetical protein